MRIDDATVIIGHSSQSNSLNSGDSRASILLQKAVPSLIDATKRLGRATRCQIIYTYRYFKQNFLG